MTTEVTIVAHCSAEKEVHVKITDNGVTEEFTLQDGGKAKRYAYEGREISMREVEKQASETKAYYDGSVATGPGPLPDLSPAEQDAAAGSPTIAEQEIAAAKAEASDTVEDVGAVS